MAPTILPVLGTLQLCLGRDWFFTSIQDTSQVKSNFTVQKHFWGINFWSKGAFHGLPPRCTEVRFCSLVFEDPHWRHGKESKFMLTEQKRRLTPFGDGCAGQPGLTNEREAPRGYWRLYKPTARWTMGPRKPPTWQIEKGTGRTEIKACPSSVAFNIKRTFKPLKSNLTSLAATVFIPEMETVF